MKEDYKRVTDSAQSRRDRILALLEESAGWCSGESISVCLGISRAAVAKHVSLLRAAGHCIEASPRRGYLLSVKADPLTQQSVQEILPTRILGQKNWKCLEHTVSTNQDAVLWALGGAEEGSIVLAEHQTGGRGRKGHAWFSAPRSLQFSLVLRPKDSVSGTELLTMLGTVAAAEAILRFSPVPPVIKPPNDIFINGRKVCGVLVELGLLAGETVWAVLGMGCNINAQEADFPDKLKARTTSLLIEGGAPLSRSELLAAILERLEFWYEQMYQDEANSLTRRWNALCKTR